MPRAKRKRDGSSWGVVLPVCLFAGTLGTVASVLPWMLHARRGGARTPDASVVGHPQRWSFPFDPGARVANPVSWGGLPWECDIAEVVTPDGKARTGFGVAAGFPVHAFEAWDFSDGKALESHGEGLGPEDDVEWFPSVVLWSRFALNTIFYAAIAWGLWQIPRAIRRRSRRRRGGAGRCVRCGYDLKGLASGSACPECGT